MLTKCGPAKKHDRRNQQTSASGPTEKHQQKNGWTSHPAEAEPVSIRCRRVHSPLLREWGLRRAGHCKDLRLYRVDRRQVGCVGSRELLGVTDAGTGAALHERRETALCRAPRPSRKIPEGRPIGVGRRSPSNYRRDVLPRFRPLRPIPGRHPICRVSGGKSTAYDRGNYNQAIRQPRLRIRRTVNGAGPDV